MNKELKRKRRGLKAKAIQRRLSDPRPRLVVSRSCNHIYGQVIVRSEMGDVVLVSSSTVDKELRSTLSGSKVEQARQVGKLLGERAKVKQITDIAFDRAGYKFHGRVKALADGAREAGLNF
ncbi:50S ribosomal protein L18 [Legionella sp. CNM-4043-24]|uniref:50S ribosomal protein L18 n=1 Tax=Legionella sp. CNM-4043-24 TaxID=3421646 RepID=UPI00403A9D37